MQSSLRVLLATGVLAAAIVATTTEPEKVKLPVFVQHPDGGRLKLEGTLSPIADQVPYGLQISDYVELNLQQFFVFHTPINIGNQVSEAVTACDAAVKGARPIGNRLRRENGKYYGEGNCDGQVIFLSPNIQIDTQCGVRKDHHNLVGCPTFMCSATTCAPFENMPGKAYIVENTKSRPSNWGNCSGDTYAESGYRLVEKNGWSDKQTCNGNIDCNAVRLEGVLVCGIAEDTLNALFPAEDVFWSKVLSCTDNGDTGTLLYSLPQSWFVPDGRMLDQANRVRICSHGSKTECITSRYGSFPIYNLRIGNPMSHWMYRNQQKQCNGQCLSDTWDGPADLLATLAPACDSSDFNTNARATGDYMCKKNTGMSASYFTDTCGFRDTMNLFHACGNHNGLHFDLENGQCRWKVSSATFNGIQGLDLYVDTEGFLRGHGHGDPHLKNIKGEEFDVMQEGNMLFLEIPRHSTPDTLNFAVHADIERLGAANCGPTYITKLQMTGAWLGEPGAPSLAVNFQSGKLLTTPSEEVSEKHAFGINVGASKPWYSHVKFLQSLSHLGVGHLELPGGAIIKATAVPGQPRTFIMKVKDLTVVISQPKRPRVFLDVQLQGLETLMGDVGGLLGIDDHTDAEALPDECEDHYNIEIK